MAEISRTTRAVLTNELAYLQNADGEVSEELKGIINEYLSGGRPTFSRWSIIIIRYL